MKQNKYRFWNKIKYECSIDYMLANILNKYGYNPYEVVVWYYNKKKNEIIFQSNFKYYQIKNNKIKEIKEQDVWHK